APAICLTGSITALIYGTFCLASVLHSLPLYWRDSFRRCVRDVLISTQDYDKAVPAVLVMAANLGAHSLPAKWRCAWCFSFARVSQSAAHSKRKRRRWVSRLTAF